MRQCHGDDQHIKRIYGATDHPPAKAVAATTKYCSTVGQEKKKK